MIGIDIYRRDNLVLDGGRLKLFVRNKSVRIFDANGKNLCNRVIADKTIRIPPTSEVILQGRYCTFRHSKNPVVSLEPSPMLYKKTGVLVANILVDSSHDTVPVRVFNIPVMMMP